ncbi:hypothetical protein HDU80_010689 [Chytriomyces hyalinus]|nr:hypothetical protein HDU80_010689 [Chytriomyces hyalinus]
MNAKRAFLVIDPGQFNRLVYRLPFAAMNGTLTARDCEAAGSVWAWVDKYSITNCCQSLAITCEGGRITRVNARFQQQSGVMSSAIGNLTELSHLILANNQYTGELPSTFSKLTKLTYLDMTMNVLTGRFPTALCSLSNLQFLSLKSNLLVGPVPSCLGSMAGLTSLNIGNNQLSGNLPSEIANIKNLTLLDVSNNWLTGSIPSSLQKLEHLKSISLRGNDFDNFPFNVTVNGTIIEVSSSGKAYCLSHCIVLLVCVVFCIL